MEESKPIAGHRNVCNRRHTLESNSRAASLEKGDHVPPIMEDKFRKRALTMPTKLPSHKLQTLREEVARNRRKPQAGDKLYVPALNPPKIICSKEPLKPVSLIKTPPELQDNLFTPRAYLSTDVLSRPRSNTLSPSILRRPACHGLDRKKAGSDDGLNRAPTKHQSLETLPPLRTGSHQPLTSILKKRPNAMHRTAWSDQVAPSDEVVQRVFLNTPVNGIPTLDSLTLEDMDNASNSTNSSRCSLERETLPMGSLALRSVLQELAPQLQADHHTGGLHPLNSCKTEAPVKLDKLCRHVRWPDAL